MRLRSLDSLRGLAALSVVFCHCLEVAANSPTGGEIAPLFSIPPLTFFTTAIGAVLFFFALSGYVLTLSLEENQGWPAFLAKRFCRIWPPFAVAITISGALAFALSGVSPAPGWTVNTWPEAAMTPLSIVGQLGMTSAMIGLDPAAWSLVHELRISFVFPLLLFGVCRSPMLTIVAALALHLIGQPYVETETYVVFFAAGCWLAVHRRALENLSFSPASNAALGTLALACLSTQIEIVSGVGGLTILVLAQSSPFLGRVLAFRWCQRLGQVSYSLYLVHMVVLMALGRALGALLTIPLILCVAIPVIWLATEASFRWVELPSIRAGRMAAEAIEAIAVGRKRNVRAPG